MLGAALDPCCREVVQDLDSAVINGSVVDYVVNRATGVFVPFRPVDDRCLAVLVELGNLVHSHVLLESGMLIK